MERTAAILGFTLKVAGFFLGLRPEARYLDSPFTSLKSLNEGKAYVSNGFSPYFEGSPVHSPPLVLYFYIYVPREVFFFALAFIELHSGYLIMRVTRSNLAFLLFYLNPFAFYMIFNLSTSILNVWAMLLFVYFTMEQKVKSAGFSLSLLFYLDPSAGILSSLWFFKHKTLNPYWFTCFFLILLKIFSDFLTTSISGASIQNWISSCQSSSFFLTDVHPSTGLRWYLMLEMFKKYHKMYSVMIAVHTWVYIYPLTSILSKFSRHSRYSLTPELYLSILFSIIFINHPHPTFYEYFLTVALFLPHKSLILQVKAGFFTICSWIIGNVLSAFMWTVWTERMGGNANFFYFQTIFTNLVAIGFVVALLYQIVEMTNKFKIKCLCSEIIQGVLEGLDKNY